MSRAYTSAKRSHQGNVPFFTHDGVKFRCLGQLTALDISEFAEVAELGVDTDDPRAAAAIAKFFRAAMGNREYGRFKTHLREYVLEDDTLIDIMRGIMEDFAARPTGQPSSSHDGPSTTGPGSKPSSRVVSLQHGTVQHLPPADAAVQASGSSSSPPEPSSTPYSLYG